MGQFRMTYYGTRGSIPAPGPHTRKYGGNTTCILLEYLKGDDVVETIIIDGGTGLRVLGMDLLQKEFGKGKGKLTLLISHTHWDHIQGIPFFVPAYIPGNIIHIRGRASGGAPLKEVLANQQNPNNFPVGLEQFGAKVNIRDWQAGKSYRVGPLKINTIAHAHPGGSLGFRVSDGTTSIAFCTDVEHQEGMPTQITRFARGCDLLAYDSQYMIEEYEGKHGWGHSTWAYATEIARAAGVGELHLIHHDPVRTDAELDKLQKKAARAFENTLVAREGMRRLYGPGAAKTGKSK